MYFKTALSRPLKTFEKSNIENVIQFRKAKVESYPLFCNKKDDEYFFVLREETGEDILYLYALEISDLQDQYTEEVIMVQQVWYAHPKYEHRGFATASHFTLHNQGFVVLSNDNPTQLIRDVWNRIKFGSLMDVHTKKITKEESDTLEQNNVFCILPIEEDKKSKRFDNYWLQERHMYIDEQPCP